jgi:hypothetical protein
VAEAALVADFSVDTLYKQWKRNWTPSHSRWGGGAVEYEGGT